MKIQAIDFILYITPLILVIFGVVVIYSITYSLDITKNYFEHQILFAGIGIILLFLFSILDYHFLRAVSYPVYIITLLFLSVLLLTPLGKSALGATRWLNLGFMQFQPSELFKLVALFLVARVCDQKELTIKHLLLAVFLILIPVIMILRQPDFGTAIIILLISASVIFTAGFQKKYLLMMVGMIILGTTVIALSVFNVKPFSKILKDYQRQRVQTFINPQNDPYKSGYNVNQSVIAVGSGGILGRGLGYGPQSQLNFIPSKYTDFIFSVSSEAFGFVGGVIILSLFFVLIWRILKIAQLSKDNYGTLLCYGIATYFIFEVIINIGMTIGLMPVAGIPLPFVSYGGTSLWVSFIAVGICQSIMVRHKKISFKKI